MQSYEGQRDLTFWQGKVLDLGFGQGEDLVLNSHYQTVASVHGGNGLEADLHEFQIAPHGVAYITAYNPIRCDLSSPGGARNGVIIDTAVQEIDMKTGLVRWEWHSLDHVNVADSQTAAPSNATPWDWFHLNSIELEPERKPLHLRAQHVGRVLARKRAAGTCCGDSAAATARSSSAPVSKRPGSTTAACSRTAKSRSSTTARIPPSTTSRVRCGSRSTSTPTKRI